MNSVLSTDTKTEMQAPAKSSEAITKHKAGGHIRALDGLRGLAILFVFVFHYGDLSHSHSQALRVLNQIKDAGWIGVDLFFTLSGFLITGILWDQRSKAKRWSKFYARRALRLFPLFYLVWFILIAYVFASHQVWRSQYWAYLFYMGNFAAPSAGSIGPYGIAHFWSLAVEEQFYLIWPFVVWKVDSPGIYKRILLASVVGSFCLKLIFLLYAAPAIWTYYLLPTHSEGLLIGSTVAIMLKTGSRAKYARLATAALPLSAILLLAVAFCAKSVDFRTPAIQLFGYPLLAVFSISLILRALEVGSMCQKICGTKLLVSMGKISYGFYIFHYLLHDVLKQYFYVPLTSHYGNTPAMGVVYVGLAFCVSYAISWISYHFMESYFLKVKERFN